MPEPALTAAEVARLLKLNVETVYTLIRKDGLPAARIGGQWRFSEEKVRAWFEARHAGACGPKAEGQGSDGMKCGGQEAAALGDPS